MKNLLTRNLLPATLALVTGNAMSHGGHLPNEAVHGFLHVEHIVMLATVGLAVYLIKNINNK